MSSDDDDSWCFMQKKKQTKKKRLLFQADRTGNGENESEWIKKKLILLSDINFQPIWESLV